MLRKMKFSMKNDILKKIKTDFWADAEDKNMLQPETSSTSR